MSKKLSATEIENIASVCHDANKAYCATNGDYSHFNWQFAPDWQKESAIKGVTLHIDSGLVMTPADSHAAWLNQKLADGWKYGETKDPDKKTHPCILPYRDLPEFQKKKDALFTAIVHTLASE